MSQLADRIRQTLDALNEVATRTLERKRRLGESAVIWQDGRIVITDGDMTSNAAAPDRPAPKTTGDGRAGADSTATPDSG